MRPLTALMLLLAALALPASAGAHAEEHRATRVTAAGCPADAGPQAAGCRALQATTAPDGTPDSPTVCAATRRSPDPMRPWTLDVARLHVQAQSGEGVAGPVQLILRGPDSTVLYGGTDAQGRVDVALPDLRPGTYAVGAKFLGSESAAVHGDPPHAYKIIYDPSSSAGTLEVVDCDEFRVTLKPTPTTVRTGMVFDRTLGRATFFTGSGDCLSSCADLTLVIRDLAGRPVEGARVTLDATPVAGGLTATGKDDPGRFCNAAIPNPARCKASLTLTTNAEGKVDGPLRYFPPALLERAQTTLKATVTSKGRTGTELRPLPLAPNVLIAERTLTISDLDAAVLLPSAAAYKDGPEAIVAEQLSKSCDPIKPLLLLPVFKPMEKVCDGIGTAFNPYGAFDKLKLLEVAWFFHKFGIPVEGAFYHDFLIKDTTSDFFDAAHDLLRNAFAVYGQAFVMQSSITLALTEVSVPPGKLALRFRATFRAPNGHAMSTIDTDVSKGYEASMFLGALAQGRGAPALSPAPVRAARAGTAALAMSCLTETGCRGSVTMRAQGRTLGRGTYRLAGGADGVTRVPLNASARRTLARRGAMRVQVTLTARTAKGSATQRRTITLRAPARRR